MEGEKVVIMCVPWTATHVIDGSQLANCTGCNCRVWVSQTSLKIPGDLLFLCPLCVVKRSTASGEPFTLQLPTLEQIEELNSWMDKKVSDG